MNRSIKRVFISLILFFTLLQGNKLKIEPFPKGGTLTDIFNTNCLQMTQSQQMLKAYIMSGLNSTFDKPKETLAEAIPLYDKRFKQIKEYFQSKVKDKEAIEAFNRAQEVWERSKKILEAPPTKEGALKLKENFNQMIPLLLVGSKPAAKGGLELLSLTGKLCRGPMKITIDYLMRIWGVDIPNYESDVESIISNFHKHLKELKLNPLNNSDSKKLLKEIESGFMYYEVMYKAKKSFVPSLLSRKADENFALIREVKAIYKQQLTKK